MAATPMSSAGTAPARGRTAKQPAMRPGDEPAEQVLDRVSGPRRAEADELLALHREVSGEAPIVWAGRIIGFGEVSYLYESGHGGIMPELAFATAQAKHTIYFPAGFAERWPELLAELGPHTASKACLYITRLARVDRSVLRALLERALEETRTDAGAQDTDPNANSDMDSDAGSGSVAQRDA
ncbi:DUF1801 domain-containing protein [Leucobacter chromiireducens]|nr:DUF1801 domain-containing protein [Leucobacter chromiireducens]